MKKKYLIVLGVLLGTGAYIYFTQGKEVSPGQAESKKNTEKIIHKSNEAQSLVKGSSALKKKLKTIKKSEKKSLYALSSVMGTFTSEKFEIDDLTDRLTDLGLKLSVATDENDSTGKMHTIRSKNTIPGTRYFHAQVFYDENNAPFVQHMSFEYQKGENAFNEAVEMAKTHFGLTKDPDYNLEGFASWQTESGYVIWVKKLEASDLKDDPYNAYTKEDVGTIKVAIEIEIH